jgi:hypothetical protein
MKPARAITTATTLTARAASERWSDQMLSVSNLSTARK